MDYSHFLVTASVRSETVSDRQLAARSGGRDVADRVAEALSTLGGTVLVSLAPAERK